ncbi:MAG: DUF3352 domain-containing protein [Terriglobia bacterium]
MSRFRQFLVLAVGLLLVGAALYLADLGRPRPTPMAEPEELKGLAWLPAAAGLAAGVDVAELRQQKWLLEMARRATEGVREESDYQAFVQTTGFDYRRDLDRLWVGLFGPRRHPLVAGVAEGRFASARIQDYARRRGARLDHHQGIEIYYLATQPQKSKRPARGFAFAFLDDTHLAFASDVERVALVIDSWLGKTPSVASDESRRAEVERLAAGRQAWAVNDLEKWKPAVFRQQQMQQTLEDLVVQLAVGIGVSEQGVELAGEARCREPRQAERLRSNLNILILVGRVALGRQGDETAQALGEALSNLELTQEGDTLRARVLLPPETLALLLRLPPVRKAAVESSPRGSAGKAPRN